MKFEFKVTVHYNSLWEKHPGYPLKYAELTVESILSKQKPTRQQHLILIRPKMFGCPTLPAPNFEIWKKFLLYKSIPDLNFQISVLSFFLSFFICFFKTVRFKTCMTRLFAKVDFIWLHWGWYNSVWLWLWFGKKSFRPHLLQNVMEDKQTIRLYYRPYLCFLTESMLKTKKKHLEQK